MAESVPASVAAAGPDESVSFVAAERAASDEVALAVQDERVIDARAMVRVELAWIAAARVAPDVAEGAPRVDSAVPSASMIGIAAWMIGIAASKTAMRLAAVSHVEGWIASLSSKSDSDEAQGGPPAGTERGA